MSRPTSYTHYRDKSDLLLSDADQFFEAIRRGALAHSLAGSLFSLLTWWIQHQKPLPVAGFAARCVTVGWQE